MTHIISGIDGLIAVAGQHLGYSSWLTVEQSRVDEFARATGDDQWIHTDAVKARTQGPFGSTISHGFLTLSLIPLLQREICRVDHVAMGVNYGLNRVRFPSPVPIPKRLRLGAELQSVQHVSDEIAQAIWRFTVEVAEESKPACVAEAVFRYYANRE